MAEVCDWFAEVSAPWWVAGGYAIELAVGAALRSHGDIDLLMLRRDQETVQQALSTWEWWAADPPGQLRPWRLGEALPLPVHDIWCRPGADQPWRVQVMLDETEGDEWVSRRDRRIRRPIASIGRTTADGVPYLAPEIQLFYKAKGLRAKDEVDFAAVRPVLDTEQRRWLSAALELVHGSHPWLPLLAG